MGKTKKGNSAKIHRNIIQGFFLIFSIFFFVRFYPSREFMLMTLLLLILITLVFRSGFCGWICPLGTIFDYIRALGKFIGGLSFMKPINKRYRKLIKKNQGILNKVDKYARYLRYLLFLWILQAAFLSIASIKDGDEHGIIALLNVLIVVVILGLFVDRAWCKYVCPLGATIGLFGKLSFSRITRNKDACINCKLCSRSCPMNIDVASKDFVSNIDCNTCLKCVDACPVDGALDLKLNLPYAKKTQSVDKVKEQVVES